VLRVCRRQAKCHACSGIRYFVDASVVLDVFKIVDLVTIKRAVIVVRFRWSLEKLINVVGPSIKGLVAYFVQNNFFFYVQFKCTVKRRPSFR
jgi:hypothetical protein